MLLVASVLASMRWLLCGGDSSKKKKKTTSVISKKVSRERIYHHHGFLLIRRNLKPHRITNFTDLIDSKTIKSAPHISVIIFVEMVLLNTTKSGAVPVFSWSLKHSKGLHQRTAEARSPGQRELLVADR